MANLASVARGGQSAGARSGMARVARGELSKGPAKLAPVARRGAPGGEVPDVTVKKESPPIKA
jgi:hypothetical protein